MKATPSKIVVYTVTEGKQAWRIDFIPVPNMPGYTHRVAVNMTLSQMYLAYGFRPNGKSACFFVQKIIETQKHTEQMKGLNTP